MGGLRKRLPFAFIAMLVGVLAICGIPGLSGSFSKDAVIQGALDHGHPWLYAVGIVTAGMTAYYMFRMLFVTFFGRYRGDVDPSELGIRHPEFAGTAAHGDADAHESHHAPAWLMNVPVAVLIVPSIFAGWLLYGGANSPWHRFFDPQFGAASILHVPVSEMVTTLVTLACVALGILIAYLRYGTATARDNAVERLRRETVGMWPILTNAFYIDVALDAIFVKTSEALGRLVSRVLDPHVVDGAVREAAITAQWSGALVRSLQTGLVRAYAVFLAVGIACFAAFYAFHGVH